MEQCKRQAATLSVGWGSGRNAGRLTESSTINCCSSTLQHKKYTCQGKELGYKAMAMKQWNQQAAWVAA
jgi:hypothetical protein